MRSSKTLWLVIACFICGVTFWAGCSENKSPYTPEEKGSIVGTVEPKNCQAKVVVMQAKPVDSTWVDKEGHYRFDNLTVGTYFVEASAPGYSIYTSKEITVYNGGVTTVPLIKLSPVPEEISYTRPQDGEEEVDLVNQIYISFNNSMDRESVESSFSIEPNLEGEFDWQNKKRGLYFRPSTSLIPETTYTVTLTRRAQTEEGDSLSFDYSFSFTTDRIRIESTNPRNGREGVELFQRIYLRFNTEMDLNSTQSAISVDPPLDYTYDWYSDFPYSGSTVYINHSAPFRADTEYTVVIDQLAKDVNGFNLKEPNSISFITEGVEIENVSPSNGALNVDTETNIRLYFNTWMDERSVEDALSFSPPIEGYFAPSYQGSNGSYFYFYAGSPLATTTKYMVKISRTAIDIYGTRLAEPDSFFFTTEPLRVVYTSPQNGATWVDTTTNVRIDFNSYMDQEKTEGAFSINPPVDGHFEWYSFDRLNFYPDRYLQANTTYTVTIDTTAQDIRGGKLPYPYQFSFSTRQ